MTRAFRRSILRCFSVILGGSRTLGIINRIIDFAYKIESGKDILRPFDLTETVTINNRDLVFYSRFSDGMNRPLRHALKKWESKSLLIFSELSKSSRIIVDIGSYTGIYAIVAATSNPDSTVIAFEPNSDLIPTFVTNLERNSIQNVLLENCGVGAQNFTANLHVGIFSDTASILEGRELEARKHEIVVKSFDSYLSTQPFNKVDLLKIDVEGYECEVLRGMERTIEDCHPIFIIEALDHDDLKKQTQLMEKFGYLKPLQIGQKNGDSRNFLWFTPDSSEKVLRTLTVI